MMISRTSRARGQRPVDVTREPGHHGWMDDPLGIHAALLESSDRASDKTSDEGGDPLPALRSLAGLRAHLDAVERQLIESARDRGNSWATIAEALGLASRQAAEQRLLRLSGERNRDPGPTRQQRGRQRVVDKTFGEDLARLRPAISAAARQLAIRPGWTQSQPLATLALSTLSIAETAAPGALYSLATQALLDLDAVTTEPPAAIRAARERLRTAITTATP